MATQFPKWVNRIPLIMVLLGGGGAFGAVGFVWYYFSPQYTDVGYMPTQPVPYSHRLHAGDMGMDCRYCHTGVEVSHHANLPPTQTCMNCHEYIKPDSPKMLPVRESWATDEPIEWVNVHLLPDYCRFNHAIHVNRGVGCESCHGRVDQMVEVYQVESLSMGWCLECHRNPEQYVRPLDKITVMGYVPESADEGERLVRQLAIDPPENCSACHY